MTLYKIEEILDGDLDGIINALITSDQSEKLANGSIDEGAFNLSEENIGKEHK